jgi:hypothetical protein
VYLLSLLLTSTAAGVSPSEPFFIVAYKQTSQEAALLAAESLGFAPSLMQVVPEPASVLLLAVVGLAARRRGR